METIANETIRRLVEAATAAPSSHNTQPWSFRVAGTTIDLLADRTRSLPVNDPHDRELIISCGAALLNLRVACDATGIVARIQRWPDGVDTDLIARVVVAPGGPQTNQDLAAAVWSRQTYRAPFQRQPLPVGLWQAIEQAAASEGSAVVALDDPDRTAVAELVAEGNHRQFSDRDWRRELARWIRTQRAGEGLAYNGMMAIATRFVVGNFNVGDRTAAANRDLALSAPTLAVLATPGDIAADWLTAGLALEHVLLRAATEGVQASFLNQPCQVPDLRDALRSQLPGIGFPQSVLRFGYPTSSIRPATRRPVTAVLHGPDRS